MTETVKKRKRSDCSTRDEENITESAPQDDDLNKELAVAKRNRYTFEEKKNILEECKTLNSRELCVKYGLNKSVLSKWRSNEEIIKNAAKTSHIKTLKKASETNELDAELCTWLFDCRVKGIQVTGPILRRQALVINSRIGGPENFKASSGWLEKWKKRTDIEELNITERLEASEESCSGSGENKDAPSPSIQTPDGHPGLALEKVGKTSPVQIDPNSTSNSFIISREEKKCQSELSQADSSQREPVRPPVPYVRFNRKVWHQVRDQNPELKIWEIGKITGQMWRELPEKEKTELNENYEAEKLEYKKNLKRYHESPAYQAIVTDKTQGKAARLKASKMSCSDCGGNLKPPEPPEKPLQPYIRYSRKVWDRVKTQFPKGDFGKITSTVGRMWRNLPKEDKKEFIEEWEAEKVVYKENLKTYHNSPAYLAYIAAKNGQESAQQCSDDTEAQECSSNGGKNQVCSSNDGESHECSSNGSKNQVFRSIDNELFRCLELVWKE